MLKISSILIGVKDLNKARPFYQRVFGFDFQEFRPPFASAVFDGVEFNIEENTPQRSVGWAVNIGGRKNVSFKTDDLDEFLSKATSFGARVVEAPRMQPWGYKEAVIADEDGNEFVIEQNLNA